MKRHRCFWSLAVFLITTAAGRAAAEPAAPEPPASIEFDGRVYTRDKAWKKDEIRLEVNLDEDPEPEIFVGFMGTWRPPAPPTDEERDPLKLVKREIPILEHRVFYQVLDRQPEGRTSVLKMWTGMDQIGSAQPLCLNESGPWALLVVSPGGSRYKEVRVLLEKEGGYPFIFDESGNGPVEVESSSPGRVRIRLGDRSWTWDGSVFRKT